MRLRHASGHERHIVCEMRRFLTVVVAVAAFAACRGTRTPTADGSPSSDASITDASLFFATRDGPPSGMQALYRGPLVVRNGCVLIGGPGDYTVPIWPHGFAAEPDGSGQIVVQDGGGTVVAVEGETFEMGGGYTVEFQPKDKVEPRDVQLQRLEGWLGYAIPERCLGPISMASGSLARRRRFALTTPSGSCWTRCAGRSWQGTTGAALHLASSRRAAG